jgi:hypothetical protein
MSPETRAICLRIRLDADRFLRCASRRLALLAKRSLLERYVAGELGSSW